MNSSVHELFNNVTNLLTVDYIRHGESSYLERDFDLTEKGTHQIIRTAAKIATRLLNQPPRDIILWMSPHARTISSGELLAAFWQKQYDLKIERKRVIPLLKDAKMDRRYLAYWMEQYHLAYPSENAMQAWHRYWREGPLPPSFEDPVQACWRFNRILYHLFSLARRWKQQGRPLPHFLLVSHQNLPEKLFDVAYGKDKPFHGLLRTGHAFELALSTATPYLKITLRENTFYLKYNEADGSYQKVA